MRTAGLGDAHLSYCTNIHPGESWAETREAVATHVREIKQRLSPDRPFGVGLRLSGAAAEELVVERELERFASDLETWGLYVFTINGFPYGPFHGTAVKESVYRPDWLEPERRTYTSALVRILARLLPEGVTGSISTVPGCFKARASENTGSRLAAAMIDVADELAMLRRDRGIDIALALEPEPCCYLETIDEAVAFFEQHLWPACSAQDEPAVRHHIGLCLDTCHAAVEFEDPGSLLATLEHAGIKIAKVQLTTGLSIVPIGPPAIDALRRFADAVYLHQVVVRDGNSLERFVDLEPALAAYDRGELSGDEWRVHFHVPVFADELPAMGTTQPFLRALLAELAAAQPTAHYEVETYTWDVLPPALRDVPVTDAIERELRWVLAEVER